MSKIIKVIDSRMGKGKTTFMLNHMKENHHNRFIFVTPYLDEVKRVIEHCEFIQPESEKNKTKLDHFKELISDGLSIATTHQLFKSVDLETIKLLKDWDYTLVLDEVLEVISISKLSKNEFNALEELGLIKHEGNTWVKGDDESILLKYSYEWKYAEIVRNLIRNSVEIFENKILVWLFPVDLLKCFKTTYILTFMFDGYPLKPYLELHNFNISKYSIKDMQMVDYERDNPSDLKGLINIYEGKYNDIGKGYNTFTVYWYNNILKNNPDSIIEIRDSLNNFYKNFMIKTKDKKKDSVIWTCFKEHIDTITTSGINSNNFVAHNLRATNKYGKRANLAYLVNRNYNPIIKRWLLDKGLDTNDDSFALSEMIQWIWRSRIRNGENINIFIPSERMRNLFRAYLDFFI